MSVKFLVYKDPDSGRVWVSFDNVSVIREADGSWVRGVPSADELKDSFERVGDDGNPSKEATDLLQKAKAAVLANPSLLKQIPLKEIMRRMGLSMVANLNKYAGGEKQVKKPTKDLRVQTPLDQIADEIAQAMANNLNKHAEEDSQVEKLTNDLPSENKLQEKMQKQLVEALQEAQDQKDRFEEIPSNSTVGGIMESDFLVSRDLDSGRVWVSYDDVSVIREAIGSWVRGAPSADELKDSFERVGDNNNPSKEATDILQLAKEAVAANPKLLRQTPLKEIARQIGQAMVANLNAHAGEEHVDSEKKN